MYHHHDLVSVYDRNGNFDYRGRISGRHKLVNGAYQYDVDPLQEFSMKRRECGIHESRVRKHYVAPHLVVNEPQNILDEA